LLFALTASVAAETDPKTGKNNTTAKELLRMWFLALPVVLGTARVREDWFLVPFIMRG
jgi:hypothetical protein